MLHHTQQNDVIGSAIIYIREHIQALLGTIVPRN